MLYRLTVETGELEAHPTLAAKPDWRSTAAALLIGFAFGPFMEGAAGFGTPVAVASAMLAGLGFSPFYAAAICLLRIPRPWRSVPSRFPWSRWPASPDAARPAECRSGRICAPMSLFIPGYIILVASVLTALNLKLAAPIVSPR